MKIMTTQKTCNDRGHFFIAVGPDIGKWVVAIH